MADVQSTFGPVAEKYAKSKVHGNAEELARLVALAEPKPTDRVLDVATGAGNMALAFAPHVNQVIAYDLTVPMLDQVRQRAEKRGLTNVVVSRGDACHIMLAPESVDTVVARLAPHHFASVPDFLIGAHNVLKPHGKLLIADTAAPDDPELGRLLNEIETLRDPSHVKNLSYAEWHGALDRAGFEIVYEDRRNDWPGEHGTHMDFDTWVERINTPEANREQLRSRFENPGAKLREALSIQRIGASIRFRLPRITVLALRRMLTD